MTIDLRFTIVLANKDNMQSIANTHGVLLQWIGDDNGVTEWRLQTEITEVDLCNFTNDLGNAGIQAVCSNW